MFRRRAPLEPHASGLPRFRLEAVVDGITAFVLTVLVFDIDRPAEASWEALWGTRASVFAFLITAAVIATFWLGHAQQMNFITRIDRALVWINFGGLAVVVLLPFTTEFLAAHLDASIPWALYGANVALVGVAGLAQWRWAASRGRHLMRPETPDDAVAGLTRRIALALALTAIGIALAFWTPVAAVVCYALAFLPFAMAGSHDRHLKHE